jgi:hypothetical protein
MRVRGFGTIFRCSPVFHAIVMGTFSERFGVRAPVATRRPEAAAESAE